MVCGESLTFTNKVYSCNGRIFGGNKRRNDCVRVESVEFRVRKRVGCG